MRRNVLVTSATGNQASGIIRSLLAAPARSSEQTPASPTTPEAAVDEPTTQEGHEYHVYAFTRHPASTSAFALGVPASERRRLHIVQGDLNDRNSVEQVFVKAKEKDGGIWGVFVVLPFPGLGADASGEERQGKMLADLSLKYGVTSFIYSSAMRLGSKYETDEYLKFSARAKVRIEEYVTSLGEKGLPWIVLQPGFFMENFQGLKGALAVSVIKKGLDSKTTISFVAAEDVGNLAARLLENHEAYKHGTFLVVSEFVTLSQIESAHQKATGKPLPSAPNAVGWGINKGSSKTRELMVKGLEVNHKCRTEGDYKDLEAEVKKTKEVLELQTYEAWKRKQR